MTITTTDERINAQGGLILVGKVLAKACDLSHLLSSVPSSLNQHFTHADILKTAVGLLSQGRTHFSDTELFRQEESQIMAHALDLKGQPSEATFRQRFENLAQQYAVITALEQANLNLLKTVKPTALLVGGRPLHRQ